MVQILKNEGTKIKLILESNQATMSEREPDDCMTVCGNTVDEKNWSEPLLEFWLCPHFQ